MSVGFEVSHWGAMEIQAEPSGAMEQAWVTWRDFGRVEGAARISAPSQGPPKKRRRKRVLPVVVLCFMGPP